MRFSQQKVDVFDTPRNNLSGSYKWYVGMCKWLINLKFYIRCDTLLPFLLNLIILIKFKFFYMWTKTIAHIYMS